MYQYGHYGAPLLAYAPVGLVVAATGNADLALLAALATVALSTVPDVDHRLPLLEHRGATHTVWFALVVAIATGVLGSAVGTQQGPLAAIGLGALGFVVGGLAIGSHVAADALTPSGVEPFAPLRPDWYSFDVVRAKNPVANVVLLGLGIVAAVIGIGVGVRLAALLW